MYKYDSRGCLRGSCTLCSCAAYDGGLGMKRCIKCGHPPGKHSNLEALTGGGTLTQQTHSSTYRHHATQATGTSSFPSSQSPPHHHEAESVTHYPQSHHPYQYHQQPLKVANCEAAGCTNPVHRDFNLPKHLPAFKYCSPECRDKDLLPMERITLKKELDELKEALQKAALTQLDTVTNRQQFTKAEPSHEPTGTTHIGTGSQSRTNPEGGTQRTVEVKAEKIATQRFGLLLSKHTYNSDNTHGFVVVGAIAGSPAYAKMEDGNIRLFDVIESVCYRSADALQSEYEKEPQECFDNHVKYRAIIKMHINRSMSLPSISNTLKSAYGERIDFTHVLALRYVQPHAVYYGMTLELEGPSYSRKVKVTKIARDSPAFCSGVIEYDDICMYVVASQSTFEDSQVVRTKPLAAIFNDLFKAQSSKKHVILFIKGSTRV